MPSFSFFRPCALGRRVTAKPNPGGARISFYVSEYSHPITRNVPRSYELAKCNMEPTTKQETSPLSHLGSTDVATSFAGSASLASVSAWVDSFSERGYLDQPNPHPYFLSLSSHIVLNFSNIEIVRITYIANLLSMESIGPLSIRISNYLQRIPGMSQYWHVSTETVPSPKCNK